MNRADDRGLWAATRASGSRVTSWEGASPFTTRGKEEKKQWLREKNGRRVLKLSDGDGHCKYWRAPRPRPRPHRRQWRRRMQAIVQAAVAGNHPPPTASANAAEVIMVLQTVLRDALEKADIAEQRLEKTQKKLQRKQEQYAELQQDRDSELFESSMRAEVHTLQLHKLRDKLKQQRQKSEVMQQRHHDEQDAAKKKLWQAQQSMDKLKKKLKSQIGKTEGRQPLLQHEEGPVRNEDMPLSKLYEAMYAAQAQAEAESSATAIVMRELHQWAPGRAFWLCILRWFMLAMCLWHVVGVPMSMIPLCLMLTIFIRKYLEQEHG